MLPAHFTKDELISQLNFHLSQSSDNGSTNGTTLWLGAQCLSAYIATHHKPAPACTTRAIELGSGIGLSALVMSSLGYSVFATDTAEVIDTVLARNVIQNNNGPSVNIRELDWRVPPERWTWNDDRIISSVATPSQTLEPCGSLPFPFDLIITSDTVYEPTLVEPLLRTLHALSTQSLAASTTKLRPPLILLCLERRDPIFIDSVLAQAREKWDFSTERVPARKLAKVMQKHALDWARDRAEWDGVEIWKMMLRVE